MVLASIPLFEAKFCLKDNNHVLPYIKTVYIFCYIQYWLCSYAFSKHCNVFCFIADMSFFRFCTICSSPPITVLRNINRYFNVQTAQFLVFYAVSVIGIVVVFIFIIPKIFPSSLELFRPTGLLMPLEYLLHY